MKRKTIALAVIAAIGMSLAACGSTDESIDTTSASAKSASSESSESTSESTTSSSSTDAVSTSETSEQGSGELTEVTVQLKWVQQAQFMGYYAADALGIYEDFGLDVNIVPGGSVDVIDEVDSGRAQFGVTWVSNLMSSVSNGANVMSIAQYYQNSGMTLVSLDGTVADETKVSEGEASGNWGGGNQYEMQSYLASLGLPNDFVTQDYDMQQLYNGDITWASAMTYNELGLVYEDGYTEDEINIISMEDEGFGMLEDCLIVDTDWAAENEETVTAFMAASNLGWLWCLENPAAAGSLVFNAEDTSNTVSEYHQQYEATEVAKLMAGDIITIGDRSTYTNMGYLDADKYAQTYDIFSEYVDISNIKSDSVFTSYFYDLVSSDEQYLEAIENFDDYQWDGEFEVLYEEA